MEESHYRESNRARKLSLTPRANNRVVILKDKIRHKKTLRYFWKSSIPQKWNELVENEKIVQFKDTNGKSRDTIAFLEEYQKYIYHISKPNIIPIKSFKRDIMPFPTRKNQKRSSNSPKLDLIRLKTALSKAISDENAMHMKIQPLKSPFRVN